MATVDVYNMNHDRVGSIELDDTVFNTEVKEHLFHEVVRAQLASRRRGTQKVKDRSEVSGTAKKPFKQKGTGRARAGDCKNPTWVGGGAAFAPNPRDYSYRPPKKVRRAAVRSALSRRFQESRLWVLDSAELPEIKTKRIAELCKAFGVSNVLFIDRDNDALSKSTRNLPRVGYLSTHGVNCYDVLRHEHVVVTRAAVEALTGALLP